MKYLWIILLGFCSIAMSKRICDHNTVSHIPIADMADKTFNGFSGNLYPDGNNIPIDHFTIGMERARHITPVNQQGQPDSNGYIGLLVLGYSTAAMTGRTLRSMLSYVDVAHRLKVIVGAQGGQDLQAMVNPQTTYWDSVAGSVQASGLVNEQVQMIWMSSGDIAAYNLPFPEQALHGVDLYQEVLRRIKQLYPSVQIVFISDRPYAGYIGINDPPGPKELAEPTAYYHSWTVKWLIEKQIHQEAGYTYTEIPFIDWGPTLWTNGTNGDKLGFVWNCLDAGKGGIHPTSIGRVKEAARIYTYLSRHPYTHHVFTPLSPSSNSVAPQ